MYFTKKIISKIKQFLTDYFFIQRTDAPPLLSMPQSVATPRLPIGDSTAKVFAPQSHAVEVQKCAVTPLYTLNGYNFNIFK